MKGEAVPDTIIVPAQKEGFERVFLGYYSWDAIRIAGAKLDKIEVLCGLPSPANLRRDTRRACEAD